MKFILLVITFTCHQSIAQDTVKINSGAQVIVSDLNFRSASATLVTISAASIQKNDGLTVFVGMKQAPVNWTRVFVATNDSGTEIFSKKFPHARGNYHISAMDMRAAGTRNSKFLLSSYLYPLDPRTAMRIRIRRVPLCSLHVN